VGEGQAILRDIYLGFHGSKGVQQKRVISKITKILEPVSGKRDNLFTFGDDAAPLPYQGSYLLLAADGISPQLLSDPFWAGYCSVLVNVNDIYAMGGKPLAMVNVLAAAGGSEINELTRGMLTGCQKFGVPMVGGHLHLEAERGGISAAILGEAKVLLTSFAALPGDFLVLAVDLAGNWHYPFPHWDSTSGQTPEEVQARLAVLPRLTEEGLLRAGKDVSNSGILGTIGMLLECSGKGGVIYLDAIPRPQGVDLADWVLNAYPGFGFVLSVPPEYTGKVISAFEQKGVAAGIIGRINQGNGLVVDYNGEQLEVIDFATQFILGINKSL